MLARRILAELQNQPDTNSAAGYKLVILVGHDTNVANLAGMLNLHWHDRNQPDDIGPGTALVFDLLRNQSGQHLVRVRLIRQTADQLRWVRKLDNGHPPLVSQLAVPGCQDEVDGLCTLPAFARLLTERIDPQCAGHANGV